MILYIFCKLINLILSQIILYYKNLIIKLSENKMAQCKECKFYKPIDDSKGDCFGHEVPATLDSNKCPTNSFQPRN